MSYDLSFAINTPLAHDSNTCVEVSNISELRQLLCYSINDNEAFSNVESNGYRIIRYNKEYLKNDEKYGLLRSVILTKDCRPVCFSPPKSISIEKFIDLYPNLDNDIIVEDFIEGTMINLFFDNDKWQIATKKNVGANTCFYSQKTFVELFNEACQTCNLIPSQLNPRFCYSFVLKHPENRFVEHIINPELYLIAVYEIRGNIVIEQERFIDNVNIKTPEKFNFVCYDDIRLVFFTPKMGAIIKHKQSGVRTKLRNPEYEKIRYLRGNQPNLLYHYLTLRKSEKVSEFLKYYPEYKDVFKQYRSIVHAFTEQLHHYYESCYIHKLKPLKEFPSNYKTHMFKLHEHYKTNLKSNNLYITNTEVIKYVNQIDSPLLLCCLTKKYT
jgi:hypothetical protein